MTDPAVSQEIQALIASFIAESCDPAEPVPAIHAAIIQARVPEEVELLARALVARTRSLKGGFGLRASTHVKRIAHLLAC